MKNRKMSIIIVLIGLVLSLVAFNCRQGDSPQPGKIQPRGYSIPTIDLSRDGFRQVIVDRESGQYLGHPTTVLLEDEKTMISVYPKGHGQGSIVMKRSLDGGLTWSERLPTPESWASSLEVPTIHRVIDPQGKKRLILFSGLYPVRMAVSEDDGQTWSELEPVGDWGGIVVMGSVERLKNGNYMALFHDDGRFFQKGGKRQNPVVMHVYKTISEDGGLTWSFPESIATHPAAHLCEPGLIRSPDSKQLAVLLRENSRRFNSFVIFSENEGQTWTEPKELPGALTGDRHTAKYAPDGRLFITFRDRTHDSPTWGDWVGWVGTYRDIVHGREGQYRVRLMDNTRGADCAYPGLELLPDGTFVSTTYGHWSAGEQPYIVSVRFTMEELDKIASEVNAVGPAQKETNVFQSHFPKNTTRTWIGPEYWANRLQDWRINDGRLECLEDSPRKPMRTVHILTRRLSNRHSEFHIEVMTGMLSSLDTPSPDSAAGVLLGAGGDLDYRSAALIHSSPGEGAGLFAGINAQGKLFIRDFTEKDTFLAVQEEGISDFSQIILKLTVKENKEALLLTLTCLNIENEEVGRLTYDSLSPNLLTGNIALVSHPGTGDSTARFWFKDLQISGDKIDVFDDRMCGPILSTGYTLSQNRLKLTAQMMPLGKNDNKDVFFQIFEDDQWRTLTTTRIIESGFTAPFQIDDWDSNQDIPYRVFYAMTTRPFVLKNHYWEGTIRHDPIEKEEMVVAAFTGNHNVSKPGVESGLFPWDWGVWFPHLDIVEHVTAHKSDFLFFSGDQVYEGANPTAADLSDPFLDYLYKWYLWCWAFRDLTKDIPSVVIPDDHDVFHGNVWGAGGKATDEGLSGADAQDSGGYKLSPEFVNMVQRTQTSHLPAPYDPAPVEQGINVYYCGILYGGISFAVVEDRKFKSPPKMFLPEADVRNGWAQNPDFKAKEQADVPGAVLLGERQLQFLEDWAADWSQGTWMKILLSQTLFSNVATLPEGALSGSIIPSLEILPPDAYAENDRPVADMDSNGWPQSERNRTIRIIRKGFAVHLSGDQHLGSTIQYGVDDWNDSGYALCTPSVANFWPRRWYPHMTGKNQKPGAPKYTGEYEDGFGNKITVHAVSNPQLSGKEPAGLHDMSPGYAIARFNRTTREISLENWPRWADPLKSGEGPYPGWPVKFYQQDNYGRKAAFYLPEIIAEGMAKPVIQIIDEVSGEIVYTIRTNKSSFRPKIFQDSLYTVVVGEPGTNRIKSFKGIPAIGENDRKTLTVIFGNELH
jgi:alkaline phosphatase D